MGRAIDVISGGVTAPGATLTAWTVATGDSLTVRSQRTPGKVWLVGMWALTGTAGVLRLRSPRLHDNVQGIRLRITATDVEELLPVSGFSPFLQFLVPQDTLIAEQSGDAGAGVIDSGSLLLYYEDLESVSGRFITNAQLKQFGVNQIGQELSITSGTTVAYSAASAINVTNDNFKANTDYALVGGFVDTRVTSVRLRGIDTGNLGVAFPGEPTQRHYTSDYFGRLSMSTGLPCIPVYNSANKAAILVDVIAQNTAVTSVITLLMVELAPGQVPPAGAPAAAARP